MPPTPMTPMPSTLMPMPPTLMTPMMPTLMTPMPPMTLTATPMTTPMPPTPMPLTPMPPTPTPPTTPPTPTPTPGIYTRRVKCGIGEEGHFLTVCTKAHPKDRSERKAALASIKKLMAKARSEAAGTEEEEEEERKCHGFGGLVGARCRAKVGPSPRLWAVASPTETDRRYFCCAEHLLSWAYLSSTCR